jgi:hypothetical protein
LCSLASALQLPLPLPCSAFGRQEVAMASSAAGQPQVPPEYTELVDKFKASQAALQTLIAREQQFESNLRENEMVKEVSCTISAIERSMRCTQARAASATQAEGCRGRCIAVHAAAWCALRTPP